MTKENPEIYERVSKNIAILRNYRGYTQTELARKAGVSHSSMAMVELEYRVGRLGQLEKIASSLGVTLGFLVDADLKKVYSEAIDGEINKYKIR